MDLATDIDDPETCTEALMNYFYILGQPGNTDNIDIRFLDLLCTHGGKTFSSAKLSAISISYLYLGGHERGRHIIIDSDGKDGLYDEKNTVKT